MSDWMPLLYVLLGGLIGTATSIYTVLTQTKAQRKRDWNRLAVDAATAEFKAHMEFRKDQGGRVAPLACYVHKYAGIFDRLDKGDITSESLDELTEKSKKIWPDSVLFNPGVA